MVSSIRKDSCFWPSCPYVIPFPLLWTRSSGVTHGRSDDISLSRLSYKKLTVLFLFLALLRSTLSCPLACSLWWSFLLCCDLPCREIHMAKNQARSWDINSLGTEALCPTTCEELNPDITSRVSWEAEPSPVALWDDLQPQLESWVQGVGDPETEDLSKPWLGDLQKL